MVRLCVCLELHIVREPRLHPLMLPWACNWNDVVKWVLKP